MKTETQDKVVQSYTIYIKASPEEIWEAITKPEWTVQYGYRPLHDFDLRVGGKANALPNEGMKAYPGVPDIITDGVFLEVNPPYKAVQTFRMNMTPELMAEGHSVLTTEITPIRSGVTQLKLTHDLTNTPQFAVVAGGDCLAYGAGGGHAEVLSGLKTLLETGKQLPPLSGPENDCVEG